MLFVIRNIVGTDCSLLVQMARSRHSLDEDQGRDLNNSPDSSDVEKSPEPKSSADMQPERAQKSSQQSTTLDEMDVRA